MERNILEQRKFFFHIDTVHMLRKELISHPNNVVTPMKLQLDLFGVADGMGKIPKYIFFCTYISFEYDLESTDKTTITIDTQLVRITIIVTFIIFYHYHHIRQMRYEKCYEKYCLCYEKYCLCYEKYCLGYEEEEQQQQQ